MEIFIMILLFYLIIVEGIKQIVDFPGLYLYTNEVYSDLITNYFEGSEIAIEVNKTASGNEIQFECSTNFSIDQRQFIELQTNSSSIPNKIIVFENTYDYYILSIQSDTFVLFNLSKINTQLLVELNITLSDKFANVSIKSGILSDSEIIVLIESTEEKGNFSYQRSDILFARYNEFSLELSNCFWDLRYYENLLMSTTNNAFVAFFAQNNKGQSVGLYIYLFSNPECPSLVQVVNKLYTIPPEVYNNSFPKIKDLKISNNYLMLLTFDNLVVVFENDGNSFKELGFNNFSEYGSAKNLGNFEGTLDTFTVTTNKNAVLFNAAIISKIYYARTQISDANSEVVYSQNFVEYIFFSTTTNKNDSYFELAQYGRFGPQYISLVNMSQFTSNISSTGPWVVLKSLNNNYVLIRQDYDGIRIFELSFPDYVFRVSSEISGNLTIIVSDKVGSISSTMSITVLTDLGSIYDIFDYYKSDPYCLSNPVYFDNLTQLKQVSIYGLIGGWNLSYTILPNESDYFSYTTYQINTFALWYSKQLEKHYIDAGIYGRELYLIDFEGKVYLNGQNLQIKTGAISLLPISDYYGNVAILYPDSLICLYINDQVYLNITLPYFCEIFKTFGEIIICARNDSVQILNCYMNMAEIDKGSFEGKIIDITFCDYSGFFVYLQTDTRVFMFELVGNIVLYVKNIEIRGNHIFCYLNLVIVLEDFKVSVYNKFLKKRIRYFNLFSGYQKALINQNIIILQDKEDIYFYNIDSPVLNSLISINKIGSCFLKSVNSGLLLTNCTKTLKIYNYTCPPDCDKSTTLEFFLKNASNAVNGTYNILIPITVTNGSQIIETSKSVSLNTFDSVLFFDDSISSYNYAFAYNVETSTSLKYYINGYSVEAVLLINGKEPFDTIDSIVQPATLFNRASLVYNYTFEDVINDYTLIIDSEVIIFLIGDEIVFRNNETYYEQRLKTSEIINGSCHAIEYIARNDFSAALVCYGVKTITYTNNYYDGTVFLTTQNQPFLFFFTLDLSKLYLTYFETVFINYMPNWMKIITGSRNHFLLLCLSSKSYSLENYVNNEVNVYVIGWIDGSFVVKRNIFIDSYVLGIESFSAMYIDGVFHNYYADNNNVIVLYVADTFFGIHAIQIIEYNVTLFQQVKLVEDPPVSLAVCSESLYVATIKSGIIVFHIREDNKLHFYLNYPASSIDEYSGINSVSTCSDYYQPTYFSFYLQDIKNISNYVLRIISITSDFNSTVHKDIRISHVNNRLSRAKSIFKSQNLITFLSNNFRNFEVYVLNDIYLQFNNMTKEQYKEMLDYYDSDGDFTIAIRAYKSYSGYTIVSKNFSLTRSGYSDSSISSKSLDLTLIIVGVAFGFLVILVIISYCVFKRLMNRKKKVLPEESESKFKLQSLYMKTYVNDLMSFEINHI